MWRSKDVSKVSSEPTQMVNLVLSGNKATPELDDLAKFEIVDDFDKLINNLMYQIL